MGGPVAVEIIAGVLAVGRAATNTHGTQLGTAAGRLQDGRGRVIVIREGRAVRLPVADVTRGLQWGAGRSTNTRHILAIVRVQGIFVQMANKEADVEHTMRISYGQGSGCHTMRISYGQGSGCHTIRIASVYPSI